MQLLCWGEGRRVVHGAHSNVQKFLILGEVCGRGGGGDDPITLGEG